MIQMIQVQEFEFLNEHIVCKKFVHVFVAKCRNFNECSSRNYWLVMFF